MSDLEFKPIHNFFRVTVSSTNYTKGTNSDLNSLQVYKNASYKIKSKKKSITLLLQLHKTTRTQLTKFSKKPYAAESVQLTMNPNLMGGSIISSIKTLMVFIGTEPEYSVEGYLNAVTAIFFKLMIRTSKHTQSIKIGYIDVQLYSKPHLMEQEQFKKDF